MPQEPVTVYAVDTGDPALMHSVDATEAVRLGHYVYGPPKGKEDDPEAMGRARARFMGGGLAQAELKSPEQREEDTRRANEAEAARTAPPVVVQMAPQPVRSPATKADVAEADEPKVRERHPAPGRSER